MRNGTDSLIDRCDDFEANIVLERDRSTLIYFAAVAGFLRHKLLIKHIPKVAS